MAAPDQTLAVGDPGDRCLYRDKGLRSPPFAWVAVTLQLVPRQSQQRQRPRRGRSDAPQGRGGGGFDAVDRAVQKIGDVIQGARLHGLQLSRIKMTDEVL